ncbi:unnamed protein product [Lepeophtheirus salmonis]|uniref:(salmon louse) hypothetical protein n=1 Tax=Lepeophtheirus salmonis TaxID=72036 RepID=A0A7R8CIG9_LEPSM|nr:unnamed protein product [Lepeophtheirus salmonis]CAF2832318.1 unnamed protein product [Lepeophtheirus salmonis]
MCSKANLKPSKLDEHFKNRHGGKDARNDIVTLRVESARLQLTMNWSSLRYVKNNKVEECFLFCHSLKVTSKAIDVFSMIKEFFTRYQLHLGRISAICTDGAPAMLDDRSGFIDEKRNS